MHFFGFFFRKYLVMSKKCTTFARFFRCVRMYVRITHTKSMEYLINKHQFKQTTKCLQFNN